MTDTHHTSRCIAHFDLESFFVSVERLKNPALIGKPVIIGSKEERGVVSSCSYEAQQYGVHSAMPGVQAYRLCPQGIFVCGSMSDYSHYSRMVRDIIAAEAPAFEQASIDEFYLDLSGMERFFHPVEWTQRIIREWVCQFPAAWQKAKLWQKLPPDRQNLTAKNLFLRAMKRVSLLGCR